MKFEIDDKTGLIYELDESSIDTIMIPLFGSPSKLRAILKAVKKTQEKPDSENYISLEPNETLKSVDVDSKIIKAVFHENEIEISKGNFISIKEIKQNQKIVVIVKEWVQSDPILEFNGIKLTYEQQRTRDALVNYLRNQILGETGVDMRVSN